MAAPSTRLPVIALDHVTKNFRVGERDLTILNDISLEISQAEFAAIVGPSGSGKSTLLNMITGIDRPSAGDVIVAGQQLNNLSENRLTKWRGIDIAIVFQFFQLLPSLSLGHNVILRMDFTGIRPPSERVARYGTCKAKNLAREPRCVFTVATRDLGLVFEGEAVKVADEAKLNRSPGPTQRVGGNPPRAALFTPSTARLAPGRLPGTSMRSRPRPCPPWARPNRIAKLACAFNHNSWR